MQKKYSKEEINRLDPEKLLQLANEISIPSKEDKLIAKLENMLQEKFKTVDATTIKDLVFQLRNDPEIKAILK